jgi:hypothetical protein
VYYLVHRSEVGVNTVSDETPERREIIRSSVITITLSVILLILGLVFWAWSSPDVIDTSPVGSLNDISPYLTAVLEVFMMFGLFVFVVVTVINLRLFLTGIRAGWTEVVLVFIVVTAMTWLMFGAAVGAATGIVSLGFIVYLYWLQD